MEEARQEAARKEQARREAVKREQERYEQMRQEKLRREREREAEEEARREQLQEQIRREQEAARELQARKRREEAAALARREQVIREEVAEQTRRAQENARRQQVEAQAACAYQNEQRRASEVQRDAGLPASQPNRQLNSEMGISQPIQLHSQAQAHPPPHALQPTVQPQGPQRPSSQGNGSVNQPQALRQEKSHSPIEQAPEQTKPNPGKQPESFNPPSMEDYLKMQSRTAQAQLTEAQRLQWSLTQMARSPIDMNGLSNAMGVDAQPTHSSGNLSSALDMFGLGQGRNSISSPMPFDAFSPSLAPSPYAMNDTHEIVQLPAQVQEDTASRFTEVNESPNGKTASHLPTPGSPVRPHANVTAGANPRGVNTAQGNAPAFGSSGVFHSAKLVKPITPYATASASATSQASTVNRGISNGPPQSVRLGAPISHPQTVPLAVNPRPAPVNVSAVPLSQQERDLNRVVPVQPKPALETLHPPNTARADAVPMTTVRTSVPAASKETDAHKELPSRVRQRSVSDEEVAGERHTKRRRTDQSRCIPPRANAPSSPVDVSSVEPFQSATASQDGKPSWKCASDTSDNETVAPSRSVVPANPEPTVSSSTATQATTLNPSTPASSTTSSQSSKPPSVRQTLEKVFDKNPHPSDAAFAKLASMLKIEDVEPVKKLFALWRKNGGYHKP
ncbi:hypothetical protein NCC49_006394 [Naganishia albida]|nr:hypothetical protein NCC49_006394 [Naganishia albida]